MTGRGIGAAVTLVLVLLIGLGTGLREVYFIVFVLDILLLYACLSALLAAILCLLVEIFGIRWFPKLLDAPYHFLYPAILALCLLGVYIETFNIANIIMACFFIAVGLYMMYAGIPTTPFILSFVLGSQMENYFRKAISYGKGARLFLALP